MTHDPATDPDVLSAVGDRYIIRVDADTTLAAHHIELVAERARHIAARARYHHMCTPGGWRHRKGQAHR